MSEVRTRAGAVAAQPPILAEDHLGSCCVMNVTGEKSVSRANEKAVAGHIDVGRSLGVLEREVRPVRIVLRFSP